MYGTHVSGQISVDPTAAIRWPRTLKPYKQFKETQYSIVSFWSNGKAKLLHYHGRSVIYTGIYKYTYIYIYVFIFFFNLTYSRWTSSLPSCLWSVRIFPSLPGSRLTIFYRDASSALLQLVNQRLNFTYSRSHAFRDERKNTNPTLVGIELTTSALAGVQVTY